MTYEVKFDWPNSKLNPNSRTHWRTLAPIKRKYRSDCHVLAKQAIGQLKTAEKICVLIEFYPPNNHRRDVDNCMAMMKSALDGLADALQVNDRQFVISPVLMDETGGFVKIKLIVGE